MRVAMAVDVLPVNILSFTRESIAASAPGVALFEAEELDLWTEDGISSKFYGRLDRVGKGFVGVKTDFLGASPATREPCLCFTNYL